MCVLGAGWVCTHSSDNGGCCAQITDVELECDGFLNYDRTAKFTSAQRRHEPAVDCVRAASVGQHNGLLFIHILPSLASRAKPLLSTIVRLACRLLRRISKFGCSKIHATYTREPCPGSSSRCRWASVVTRSDGGSGTLRCGNMRRCVGSALPSSGRIATHTLDVHEHVWPHGGCCVGVAPQSAKAGMFDESMSTFFRNVDTRFSGGGRDIPLDGGRNPIKMLRARSVLIDTESGVLKQVVNGPLGELFDHHQFVTDVESSGAGNNWCVAVAVVCVPVLLHCSPGKRHMSGCIEHRAHGHEVYGPKYEDAILSQVHQAVECCDSPQSFFTIHSLGGGTGSGLGTYIVALLKDEYPDIYRFNAGTLGVYWW